MNVQEIRNHFPSLKGEAIFFDNPGGTQVPQEVIQAVSQYYLQSNSNTHGQFKTSQATDLVIREARVAMADFLHAPSFREIVFGQNMTTLTFHLAQAIAKTIKPGDEIIVTRLDHDAKISPWLYLQDFGARIRWVDIQEENCQLDLDSLNQQLSDRTKLLAVGYASNAVGTINPVKKIIEMARQTKAWVFVDAVHYAPHGPIDVQELDCDFLACSAYKFYGPHAGVLYGKDELLNQLTPAKVRPASDQSPERWETGTLNHEGLAGVRAAVDFLAGIGEKFGRKHSDRYPRIPGRAKSLKMALSAIKEYEYDLSERLVQGLQEIPRIHLWGITQKANFSSRTPTVAFTLDGTTPQEIAAHLGSRNIYVWDGNYYALALMDRLGLEEKGGAVRVGMCFYNTTEEIDRFLFQLNKNKKNF